MLTEKQIQECSIPTTGTKKIFDAHGLHLHIFPNGSKRWRYHYYIFGKNKILALGVYPAMSLKEAREAHEEARALLRKGIDPCAEKQRRKLQRKNELFGNSFAEVAKEWCEINKYKWNNQKHIYKVHHSLNNFVFPYIGKLPINSITPMQILRVLERLKDRAETLYKTKQRIKAIFDYAIITGRCPYNPASVIPQIVKRQTVNQPSLPKERLVEFFIKLEAYRSPVIRLTFKLLIITFLRNSELRLGEWSEINGNEWHIPAERMKMKKPHIVPLSNWALDILNELKSLSKNHLIIHGATRKPISDNTLAVAMRRMGYQGIATPHGFRAMASTILNESGLFSSEAIERQLSHTEQNKVRAAYNRGDYLEERHQMMQWYSDYIKKQYLIAKGEL